MDYINGTGQKLWERAKTIIPGANQLLSKRSEMYLPGLWPSYYSKASGYKIWDMDGVEYNDFATMGIGACALGYADSEVNNRVKDAIDLGSMSTLNCFEEVELAEKLIDLHPWANMARFSRSGGEVCSIAIRIARAATKKNKILFCGYHGWHDWYLSSNIEDPKNLDQQLLSGLSSNGVVKDLRGSSIPFAYNDLDSFTKLIDKNRGEIAAVIMEPVRGSLPKSDFLEGIREITKNEKIVLIFDEITSGFRINLGGVHLEYGIQPDMAVFGKALGNGFPISAVIGKSWVMNAAQQTFVSSTFWTERVGYVAALATLEKFEENHVHKHLTQCGERVNEIWNNLATSIGIDIHISGLLPLTHIDFEYSFASVLQTLYSQEMLKRGHLLGSSIYTTYAYDKNVLDLFEVDSLEAFKIIKKAIDSGKPEEYLISGSKHSGFQRLT
ncbi:aminotransferase class III-fold pyridoxal phosphate-dependent enzyme [Amylibacter sp.]|nr:aminotransferase class III-fold pyridoxal phosphate-dependent enzyme [Amylibacter sp.]